MAFIRIDKVRVKLVDFYYSLVAYLPTLLTYSLCCVLTIFFIDRAEKIRFTSAANNDLHQSTISQEVFDSVKAVINEASVLDSTWTIVVVILCFWASQILLRHAAGINWSRAVTLPTAIEFSSAMRKIGKLNFAEQMACIYEHSIPVYIANDPILEDQGKSVRAKLYQYVRNDLLVLEAVLTKSIGKRQLCLNATDYEPIYQQYCQTAQSVALAKIAELERNVDALQGALSILSDENNHLTREKSILERNLEMALRRNEKDNKYYLHKVLLWRVLIPLVDRLKAEGKREGEYTSSRIQKEFFKELERHPEFKEDIQKLLWPKNQKTDEGNNEANGDTTTAKKVPDRVIEIIKDELQNLARRTAGAPPRS